MDTMLIMDFIIVGFGVYMLYICVLMRRTGKIHPILLNEAQLKTCRKEKEFVAYILPRLAVFGTITLLDGGIGIVCRRLVASRLLEFIYMIVFLCAFLWFAACMKKARGKYC